MPLSSYKPITPSLRYVTRSNFEEITKTKPEKRLLRSLRKTGGRNHHGRITSWQKGGGHKRLYRIIDFKRDKLNIPGKVTAIEYDPNRTVRIALITYADGDKRYILAPQDLKVGDSVLSGDKAEIKPGHCLKLKDMPLGSFIHNIELMPGRGGQLVRTAGTYAILMAKEGQFAQLKLPSNEVRLIPLNCFATLGQLSNSEHFNITIGKAGRSRWLGRRPHVRGVAMNPIDHPLGGGEGRNHGGRHPVTPWGIPTKGYKTRGKKKLSNKYIVQRRPPNKRRYGGG